MVKLVDFSKYQVKKTEDFKFQPEEKIIPGIEIISAAKKFPGVKKVSKSVKTPKDFEIKTDHFRTGIALIIGATKRDQPPILKEKLLEFLNKHELIRKERTWYWSKIS